MVIQIRSAIRNLALRALLFNAISAFDGTINPPTFFKGTSVFP
jgi:hypothetical protein